MTAIPGAGPELPSYRQGHCGYSPDLSDRVCGDVAVLHLWIGPLDESPGTYTIFACETHALDALGKASDAHPVDFACIAHGGALWLFDDPSRCVVPGEEIDRALEALAVTESTR